MPAKTEALLSLYIITCRGRYCLKTHPYYHAEAFPDQAQYAGWRVKEQMRLAEAIEHVQGMPAYEGSLVLRMRQGTGIHHEEEVRAVVYAAGFGLFCELTNTAFIVGTHKCARAS